MQERVKKVQYFWEAMKKTDKMWLVVVIFSIA